MSDFQNQQVRGEQDQPKNREAEPGAMQWPATAEVRKMIADHSANPTRIARLVNDHPKARDEIMALVHQSLGNAYAVRVTDAINRIFDSENEGGSDSKDIKRPDAAKIDAATEEVRKPDDAPVQYEAADGRILTAGKGPATSKDELRANADFKGPVDTSSGEGKKTTDPAKARAAADEASASDAELGVGTKKATDPVKAAAAADEANASDAELGVGGGQKSAKVAKDETVVGASSEVKAPEIVKQTEVLKDPTQKADEPQKADANKDDEGENEAVGGTKPDIGPVKVTASVLRVRSTPTIGRDNILGRLMRNQVVEAIGHQGDWVEINYRGQTAFIHSSFVVGAQEAPAPKTAEPPTAAAAT